ncbi:hypothetical protein B0A49_08061 [Cryomyces minteri]|uniref:Uncharacterized protein n=1 Tax=Cryomyces minteri TaxID=331657 RepID=A0A4U0X0F1_9PEZI|nr:hypothetical protein B0A49_08061 [Cryomyces minteri]
MCDAIGGGSSNKARCSDPLQNDDCCGNLTISPRPVKDVEKGYTLFEHVKLSVSGLTCVGCENKLFRSLDVIPSVRNLKTSLVLAQAEFDLDLTAGPVSDVVRSIERTTGFSCEIVKSRGQELEVIVTGDVLDFLKQTPPEGVQDMTLVNKQTVRIAYDAKKIGARDLLENCFNIAVCLAAPQPHPALAVGSRHVRSSGYVTLVSAALTIPVLVLAWAPLPSHPIVYGSTSLALATAVQFGVAGPFYPSAIKSLLFTRVIEMDLLIVLSTTAAYVFSIISFAYQVRGQPLSTEGFFQTSTLLVTLIMVGRFVSALARQKAVESISIRSLQGTKAILTGLDCGSQKEIDARLLQYGDAFLVAPESRVVTDGIVVSGTSEVDESMVTGEFQLLKKVPGSSVIAGSLNSSGPLTVQLTRLPGNNTISDIAVMVDEAKFSKPKVQDLADRVAGYFVPVVIVFAIVTFAAWIAVGKAVRHQTTTTSVVQAITYSISVLIVSCPCAIGLAVPMVIVIAGGVAAKHGVIFKSAGTIETARNAVHVVFDKTGTLTQGRLKVLTAEYPLGSQDSISSAVLGLTSNIKHPVSIAISKYLKSCGTSPADVSGVKTVSGKGVEGTWHGASIRAGNSGWVHVEHSPHVESILSQALTAFCVTKDDELVAVFGLEDSLRPDASVVVSELIRRGIEVSIVSGDDHGPVRSFAAKLGIPSSHFKSRCSPEDKQHYIKDLVGSGGKTILFCGDGTNDAVALAEASIGVHMNGGTDVAQSAADVVLVRPSLTGILTLMDLSRASYRRIVFNFIWAFAYNIVAILLAAGAFVHARIPPQYAGLGEIVSVVPVILIALQLKWAKFD